MENKHKRFLYLQAIIAYKSIMVFWFIVFFLGGIHSQTHIDPNDLPKNSFIWNEEEIIVGLKNFDLVFEARKIPTSGYKVKPLPDGQPFTAFEKGGDGEQLLAEFVDKHRVSGLLILHDGKIRMERYELGHSEHDRWTSQSVAKSVTGTLVGAAIRDGYIKSLEDYIITYIPGLKGSAYEKVTVHQLLSMTTGVEWNEGYADPESSDLMKFFTRPIEPGMGQNVSYLRSKAAVAEPGTKWNYNTAESHLLGTLVSNATGTTLSDYLSEKIWIPYGMEGDATWLTGLSDQELAGCCLQMKLRDFGRFGQFMLDKGLINGESVLPENWFDKATTSQATVWGPWGYGYQWWTFGDGTFRAVGIHGQMIHVDPSRNLVVVINSAWPEAENYERQLTADYFLRYLSGEIDHEALIKSGH